MNPISKSSLLDMLRERLQESESLEWEFKAAKGNLPNSLWETVSAFANTNGGWIVLGVSEGNDKFVVEGVTRPKHLIQEFHNLARNSNKINRDIFSPDSIRVIPLEDSTASIIVIRVLEASRKMRPVYISGNAYKGTFVRRNEGDYSCTEEEVNRMMREASEDSPDAKILKEYSWDDLDLPTFRLYRRLYDAIRKGDPFTSYEDDDFLRAIGGYRIDRSTHEEGITVAGVLMFGKPAAIRDWRTRHLIDYRSVAGSEKDEHRWLDRVVWEGNLLGAFYQIYPKLVANLPVPFRLAGEVRIDESDVHVSLREALVNLLIHTDYAESQASLIIQSPQGFLFRNPGVSRVPESDLLHGNRSDLRNPELVKMFHLIGLAEEAGTGLPKIAATWRDLGFQVPLVVNDRERYEFTLDLSAIHLLPNNDRSWLRSIGKGRHWSVAEQLALVTARREGSVNNLTLRQLTGQHPTDVTRDLGNLRDSGFLELKGSGRAAHYELGPATRGEMPVTPDSGYGAIAKLMWRELEEIAEPVRLQPRSSRVLLDSIILELCARTPLSRPEIAKLTQRRPYYVTEVVRGLVASGQLAYLYAEQPTHPSQRYIAVNFKTTD